MFLRSDLFWIKSFGKLYLQIYLYYFSFSTYPLSLISRLLSSLRSLHLHCHGCCVSMWAQLNESFFFIIISLTGIQHVFRWGPTERELLFFSSFFLLLVGSQYLWNKGEGFKRRSSLHLEHSSLI